VKGVCPGCGFAADLEAYLSDAHWRAALVPALAMPTELAPLVLQYLRLFAPAKQALRAERAGKLLAELAAAVNSARAERGGVQHVAPVALWKEGIEEVLKNRDAGTLSLPLKTHGYLFQVVAGLASRINAGQQRQREAGARGETPVGYSPAHQPFDPALSRAAAHPSPASGGGAGGEGSRPRKSAAPVSLADTLKSLNLGAE
jgi:hypothetical protein